MRVLGNYSLTKSVNKGRGSRRTYWSVVYIYIIDVEPKIRAEKHYVIFSDMGTKTFSFKLDQFDLGATKRSSTADKTLWAPSNDHPLAGEITPSVARTVFI